MKRTLKSCLPILLGGLAFICHAQTVAVPTAKPYSMVSEDLNSRTWQRVDYEQLPTGKVIPHVQSYTELATGLNFTNPVTGRLEASKAEVDILPDGTAAGTHGQHSVFFPVDIGNGAIRLVESDGHEFTSEPLCLSYWDGMNAVMIAELTNSVGRLISANQVLYPNAFGAGASLLYTYTKAGLEQDVILEKQPPTPQSLGLNPDKARLRVLTEFFNSARPTLTARTVSTLAGDIENDYMAFGTMSMGPGKAFRLGAMEPPVGIERQWVTQSGRQILIEEVPVVSISDELARLPLPQTSSRKLKAHAHIAFSKSLLPSQRHWRISGRNPARMVARATELSRGFVLDYIMVNGNVTNYTFRGDSTYYISSDLDLFGTNNVFEGGSVVKFATNAAIIVEGNSTGTSIETLASDDRPVIFTASDDNTIGNEITGSTGNPQHYYGNPALDISGTAGSPGVLSNLRVSYAQSGIEVNGQTGRFFNVQFMHCGVGCELIGGSAIFENALFGNVLTNFSVDATSEAEATNATFSGSFTLAAGSGSLSMGNCILANVTNSGSATHSADYDGFYNSPAFGSNSTTNQFYPFQTVGGGNYYLLPSTNGYANAFRGFGTVNIDPVLLAQLQNKTTWPPIVYVNTNISGLATLSPQAARDTNSIVNGTLDLGWHYGVMDYAFGGCYSTSNLTVTTGTAVGCFDYNGDGIELNNGGGMTFDGDATQPCVFVFADMVQEGGNGNWTGGEGGGNQGGIVFNGSGAASPPLVSATFTKMVADNYRNFFGSETYGAGVFKNCEFYNCSVWAYGMQYLTFTNCLFFRPNFTFWDSSYVPKFTNENCTYYNGELALARNGASGDSTSFWSIENTIFDGTLLAYLDNLNGNVGNTFFEYNAYNTNNLSWKTYGFPYGNWTQTNTLENLDSSDVMVTNYDWETSWFGNFYLPTNSPLIEAGSTTSDQVGLYEFTTQTNQTPEGTNIVDIGYHYVATDTNGNPLDTYVPGIPNYIVDAQGNGVDTNGLPYWWEGLYFGQVGLDPNSDPDDDGYDLLYDYTNEIDPDVIQFNIQFTNLCCNVNPVPAQLAVVGVPYYIAILVDDTNFNDAVWSTYTSSNITVNLGSQGWHEVGVGIRGHADSPGAAVWQWQRLKLDTQGPAIIITNPAVSVVSEPMIQLQGYTPRNLAAMFYSFTNGFETVTGKPIEILSRFYDTNSCEFTTNYFQAFDAPLFQGTNSFVVYATDTAGNTSATNFNVVLDYSDKTNAPIIQLYWPQNGTKICESTFTWRGMISDPTATVAAQVVDTSGNTNTFDAVVGRDGRFWVEGLPTNGNGNLTLTVTDVVGNVAVTNITILPGDLSLTLSPPTDSSLWNPTVTVTGTTSDSTDYALWVNGVEATLNGDGTWTANNVPVTPGGSAAFQVRAIPVSGGGDGGEPVTDDNLGNPNSSGEEDVEASPDKPAVLYMKDYTQSLGEQTETTQETYDGQGNQTGFFQQIADDKSWMNWDYQAGGSGGGTSADDVVVNGIYEQGLDNTLYLANWSFTFPVSGTGTETLDKTNIDYDDPEAGSTQSLTEVYYPSVPSEHCDLTGQFSASTPFDFSQNGTETYSVSVYREAQTTYCLQTGGKGLPGLQTLFNLNASAQSGSLTIGPPWANGNGLPIWSVSTAVSPTNIQVQGQSLDQNGNLQVVLPNNASVDVTPASGANTYYTFSVGASPHVPGPDTVNVQAGPDAVEYAYVPSTCNCSDDSATVIQSQMGYFTVTRTGDTNRPLYVAVGVGGTAQPGLQYDMPATEFWGSAGWPGTSYPTPFPYLYFAPGQSSIQVQVYPIFYPTDFGSLSVELSIGNDGPSGPNQPPYYTVGQATATISVDDSDGDLLTEGIPFQNSVLTNGMTGTISPSIVREDGVSDVGCGPVSGSFYLITQAHLGTDFTISGATVLGSGTVVVDTADESLEPSGSPQATAKFYIYQVIAGACIPPHLGTLSSQSVSPITLTVLSHGTQAPTYKVFSIGWVNPLDYAYPTLALPDLSEILPSGMGAFWIYN